MSYLSEAKVQVKSLEYLSYQYELKSTNGKMYVKKEVRTKPKYGAKRADGLIVFKHWIWGIFVVSIEAKSIKTLKAIKPFQNDKRLFMSSLKAGLAFCIMSGAMFAYFKMNDGFVQYMLPLNVFVLGSILYAFLRFDSYKHLDVKVIDQSAQYPADEHWLAFSMDSLEALSKSQVKMLKSVCKSRGVGVLLVKPNGKVKRWVKPRMRWKLFGNFVEFYSNEEKILKEIGARK